MLLKYKHDMEIKLSIIMEPCTQNEFWKMKQIILFLYNIVVFKNTVKHDYNEVLGTSKFSSL